MLPEDERLDPRSTCMAVGSLSVDESLSPTGVRNHSDLVLMRAVCLSCTCWSIIFFLRKFQTQQIHSFFISFKLHYNFQISNAYANCYDENCWLITLLSLCMSLIKCFKQISYSEHTVKQIYKCMYIPFYNI